MVKNIKGELTWDTLIPWMIALGVLGLILIFSFLLKDKLIDMGEYLRNIFRR